MREGRWRQHDPPSNRGTCPSPIAQECRPRVAGTLKAELEAWRARSLADLDIFGLYLDAIALQVRSTGKVTSIPVLSVVAIRADGQKQLEALDPRGGESFEAWKEIHQGRPSGSQI